MSKIVQNIHIFASYPTLLVNKFSFLINLRNSLLIVIVITRNVVIETLIVIGVNDHHEEIVRDHEIGIVIEEDRDHLVTANHPVVVINIRKVNAKREINLIVKLRKKSKRNQMTTLNNCCSEKDLFFS